MDGTLQEYLSSYLKIEKPTEDEDDEEDSALETAYLEPAVIANPF
jgi:hypothetical protein